MYQKILSHIKWLWLNGRQLHIILAAHVFLDAIRKDKAVVRHYHSVLSVCILDEFKKVPQYKTVGKLNQIAFANNAAKRYLELWLRK